MFSLNMLDYPMSFLSLSTWTSRVDHYEPFYSLSFFCGTSPSCLKVRVGGGGGGGLQHFSFSPRPLGFGFFGFLVLGLRVRGLGLTMLNTLFEEDVVVFRNLDSIILPAMARGKL